MTRYFLLLLFLLAACSDVPPDFYAASADAQATHAAGFGAWRLPVRPGRSLEAEGDTARSGEDVADAEKQHGAIDGREAPKPGWGGEIIPDAMCNQLEESRNKPAFSGFTKINWWATEPELGRVADGMAHRVDRLRAIGNGQVPGVVKAAWEALNE